MIYQAVLKTQPDGKLATLAAAGSEPAFEAIVHRYRRPLMGYCRRLRLSDNRSEDVVQQTFMNAWGSLRQGAEVRELRPWLYRITHNQAVSMLRASGRDDTSLNELLGGPLGLGGEEFEATASVEVVYERQTRLREALMATAVDGLSYDEVAAALNTTGDAVRGLVYRARNSLRAGVAVVSPSPLVVWAANHTGQVVSVETVGQWLTEASLGGGSVGLSAVAVKSAVVIASSAAVVGGTVGSGLERQVLGGATHRSGHGSVRSATAAASPSRTSGAGAGTGRGHTLAHGGVATASVGSGQTTDVTSLSGHPTGRSATGSVPSRTGAAASQSAGSTSSPSATSTPSEGSSSTPSQATGTGAGIGTGAGQGAGNAPTGTPSAADGTSPSGPASPGAAAIRPVSGQTNGQMQAGASGQLQTQSPNTSSTGASSTSASSTGASSTGASSTSGSGTGATGTGSGTARSGGGTAGQSGGAAAGERASGTVGQSGGSQGGTRPVAAGQPSGSGASQTAP